MRSPLIAHIKRHSLEDGPGIRSVVFFKGCPLRCSFCHNPEMQRPERELLFHAERCIRCGECVAACLLGAISLDKTDRIDRRRCDDCGRCARACPSSALDYVGCAYTIEALVEVLLRDQAYYRKSGGGVTLSGGECTLFPDYVENLARALVQHDIHLVVETAGEFDGGWFVERLLPLINQVYFDVKLADGEAHREHTGGGNQRIWENLALLIGQARERVEVRIPLVPGITATPSNLIALGKRLRRIGVLQAILLPYNPLGREKSARLGRDLPPTPGHFMTKFEVDSAIAVFKSGVTSSD